MVQKNDNDDDQDDNFYDLNEAVEVTWDNLPQTLRDKYSFEDIHFILEQEYDYLVAKGIFLKEDEEPPICDYPRDINQEEMEKYIVTNAIKNDIFLTYEDWDEILGAELVYWQMNGALGDMGEYYN